MQLARPLQECLAPFGIAPAVADVPLARRHDLERPLAALVELHRVRDRPRLAEQLTSLGELLHDALLRLLHRLARDLLVARPSVIGREAGWRARDHAAVLTDDRARRELQLAPPGDVGGVTERADHRDAAPLLGVGEAVRDDRHLHVVQRRAHARTEQRHVALVVGMRDKCDACGKQLGPRGLDDHVSTPARLRLAPEGLLPPPPPPPLPSLRWNARRWYAPGVSLSSISACAIAVWSSTSQSVGASAW